MATAKEKAQGKIETGSAKLSTDVSAIYLFHKRYVKQADAISIVRIQVKNRNTSEPAMAIHFLIFVWGSSSQVARGPNGLEIATGTHRNVQT